MRDSPPKLVVFALDAMDGELVDRWQLPCLSALARRGHRAPIVGRELISEHGIWASLFSGRSREEHGYYHWRPLGPGSYDLGPADLSSLAALPFWVRDERRALVVDAPECPPHPGLPGVQIANWAPHNPRYPRSSEPADQLGRLRRRFGPPVEVDETLLSSPRRDAAVLRKLRRRLAQKRALCRLLVREVDAEVVVIGFQEAHIAGHQFGPHANDPDSPLQDALHEIYATLDAAVAELLELLPDDIHVAVLSNMGLATDYPNRDLTHAFCARLGYLTPAPSGSTNRATALARRLLPTATRRWLIHGVLPRAATERLVAERFRQATDWDRTTVFPIPSFYVGFLRVNLAGREPSGTVGRADYAATLARVEADLRALTDPVDDRPAVGAIVRGTSGPTPPAILPDLMFEWLPATHPERCIVHPRAELRQIESEFCRATRHRHRGFLIAAGPGFASSELPFELDALDVAPRLAAVCGEAAPDAARNPSPPPVPR